MGNPKAFLSIERKEAGYRPILERVLDYGEVEQTLNNEDRKLQASRCMDCGVPFCHWSCPLGNRQPEWQDRLFRGDIIKAYQLLSSTDDFPEFTGRICPALCEKGCVLNQTGNAVTIRENEASITEQAFREGYIKPCPPKKRSGKKVAVVGSGPSGLTVANRLNKRGHSVTVFEKDEEIGGLLRFGIPDFKLNKNIIDRRLNLLKDEGIEFMTGCEIGKDIQPEELIDRYDAVCIAIGSGVPRDLNIEGRDLNGIYFALDYLKQQNRINAGYDIPKSERITAKNKHVVVIGGGDTGSDCVGTANRQGAKSVTQIEIMPKPPIGKNPDTPWPYWPVILKTTSSHEEGCVRKWLLNTRKFEGDDNGNVKSLVVEEVEWIKNLDSGRLELKYMGKTEQIEADLVLLALGFLHPVQEGLLNQLKIEKDSKLNIKTDESGLTSAKKVFAAGDAATGQSLVVKCIASGKSVAKSIDTYLKNTKVSEK